MDARIEARLRPGTDYHPLQVIPFFRRFKPSQLRSIVLTAIMCSVIITLISLTIAAFGGRLTWSRIQEIAVFTLAIGYVQHFMYTLVIRTSRRKRSFPRNPKTPLTAIKAPSPSRLSRHGMTAPLPTCGFTPNRICRHRFWSMTTAPKAPPTNTLTGM